MNFDSLKVLLETISIAVGGLRTTLEANDMDLMPQALEQARLALESSKGYPGGVEKLKEDIESFPEEEKQTVLRLLDQAAIDHQINGELIKLAMQRSAAMQSFIDQQAPGATYGRDGGVPGSVGGVLSRKV